MTLELHKDAASCDEANPLIGSSRYCLPDAIAHRLLDLLSSDDMFRARFERDPCGALAEIGYETSPGLAGVRGLDPVMNFDVFKGGLASKEAISAARERWQSGASNRQIFSQFDICAR